MNKRKKNINLTTAVLPKLWTQKKLLEDGEPLFLQGEKPIGILLIHGWSSTPDELRSTAFYLNKLGYWIYAPLLRGHGTDPRDLAYFRWEDWLEDVCRAYDDFRAYVPAIVVGGMSTGSILALHLSTKKDVKAIIAMGTPFFFRWGRVLKTLIWLLQKRTKLIRKRYVKEDLKIATRKIHYFEFPPKSLYEAVRSISAAKKIIPKISQPILIMHSRTDNIILPRSSEFLFRNVRSGVKRLVFVEDSYHVFTSDKNAPQANRVIGDFIEEVVEGKK